MQASPQGAEWVAWKRNPQTKLFLLNLQQLIQETQDQWANGAYGNDMCVNAEARGTVVTMDKILQWVEAIEEQPRQEQQNGQ